MEDISHITIIVKDLQRSSKLFCDGLGAKEIYDSKDKNFSISREKFFELGGVWFVTMEGKPIEKSYRHIAFKVSRDSLQAYREKLTKLGATIIPSRNRIEGEGDSLYFYDYDNNFFELHAGTLEERLAKYNSK
ncbi:MAG: FosX/FosE/FosI family fosfomycin resistance thiol transferase [Proteobacteria bacterium]|nr:MAG: FosX/FosE/FosI family fosfomycin resistance thiol transferase [Pseudomonadota bacterium]